MHQPESIDGLNTRLQDLLLNGNPDALKLLLKKFGPHVRLLLIRKCKGVLRPGEIEDVLMIAVEKIWSARTDFDPKKGSVVAWYRQIALNAAADLTRCNWCRQRQREREWEASDLDLLPAARPQTSPAATEESGQLTWLRKLQAALRRLPALYRRILMADACSSTGKLGSGELAERNGVAPSTIRSSRHRALVRLRNELECAGQPTLEPCSGLSALEWQSDRLAAASKRPYRENVRIFKNITKAAWRFRLPRLDYNKAELKTSKIASVVRIYR